MIHGTIWITVWIQDFFLPWLESFTLMKLCNWLSFWRLVSWINPLPPVCWSTSWKSTYKQQLGCRFDIMDNISSLFLYFDICNCICLDTSYLFRLHLYFLNNVLYFFSSNPVLTVSIDVVFILSIWSHYALFYLFWMAHGARQILCFIKIDHMLL